ncbi:chemotaxis response regulator protein-glutamate methylesterase [Sporosarcina sp. NCCP-2222]|uniref:protein-glutamate methylesterase/protein-glutamine glutaminase n=1 Tax=Sporosarcina sp. NCCP-2222 TaxID=2935073 RepID=UPI002081FE52|nr:chemotaxis response regulator protein-glutamate methylesterase [Sporosarcina sp. NCCP-2222]GKV55571.1 chemotaxis response regulator protein-glutamate methylesterase [Sporosarcina sp. NCCP-2222]
MRDVRKKVLVVDDSAFMRKLISEMLSSHPDLEVIATARNGKDALEKVQLMKPDVVSMDIEMPVLNGLEALKLIMETNPVPIVMLSSTTEIGATNTMTAMEYGAVDFVAKPGGPISLNLKDVEREIVEKVVAASKVKIATLTAKAGGSQQVLPETLNSLAQEKFVPKEVELNSAVTQKKFTKSTNTFVIIGTSTGGPRALQEVLTKLPSDIGVPILVVQHMPPGFTKSLADRLDGLSGIHVKEAIDGELLSGGTAYIAPGGKHLKIVKIGTAFCVRLDSEELPRMGHRPSVDVLFESAAAIQDARFVAVVMTGMGHDGKAGMQILKKRRNAFCIAESEKTSVIYGMPKAIIESGLADQVVDLQNIASTIVQSLKQ